MKKEVKCGTKMSELREISQYIGKEGYVVNDILNDKNIIESDTEVPCYMHIGIYHVKEKPSVVISVDPIDMDLVDKDKTLEMISNRTGINKDSIIIDFVTDGQGHIIEIVMYLKTKEEAKTVSTEPAKKGKKEDKTFEQISIFDIDDE